jgi:hypothetical protein
MKLFSLIHVLPKVLDHFVSSSCGVPVMLFTTTHTASLTKMLNCAVGRDAAAMTIE